MREAEQPKFQALDRVVYLHHAATVLGRFLGNNRVWLYEIKFDDDRWGPVMCREHQLAQLVAGLDLGVRANVRFLGS